MNLVTSRKTNARLARPILTLTSTLPTKLTPPRTHKSNPNLKPYPINNANTKYSLNPPHNLNPNPNYESKHILVSNPNHKP